MATIVRHETRNTDFSRLQFVPGNLSPTPLSPLLLSFSALETFKRNKIFPRPHLLNVMQIPILVRYYPDSLSFPTYQRIPFSELWARPHCPPGMNRSRRFISPRKRKILDRSMDREAEREREKERESTRFNEVYRASAPLAGLSSSIAFLVGAKSTASIINHETFSGYAQAGREL